MKVIARIAASVTLALAAVAGGMSWWLAGSLPSQDGTVQLSGLKASVTIGRDDAGVPRILAQTAEDAYFALGYVHAQDRLWQMEVQRRAGAGRLAEILGSSALPTDRFTRTLGLYRLARQSADEATPELRRALEAYSAGVNAYSGRLPPEFLVLGLRPEPWTPADCLVFGKLLAMQLAGNWREELLRARLSALLPPDQMADLFPAYDPSQPISLGLDEGQVEKMLAAIPPLYHSRLASNVWVVSGEHSETGKPLLANDPHLAFQAPIQWYMAVIATPELEVSGATIPGQPFHLLGHNKRIAWGLTTTHSDSMDLFAEKPDGDGYLTPEGRKNFVERTEVIKVRGGDPVTLTVRETRHGPVISDLLAGKSGDGNLLALSAVALMPGDRTAQAFYDLNRAENWTEFRDALKNFHAPQQNIAYADVDGHIGMISPARMPIRKSGDGTLPRPGWVADYDWIGWIPFDGLPQKFDPPSGMIINSNNKVVGDDYPYLLTTVWPPGYRAQRIKDVLESQPRHSAEDMSALQMDEMSLMAVDLLPLLLAHPAQGPRAAIATSLLKEWDGVTDRRRPEPLIFEAWTRHLQRALLAPKIGAEAESFSVVEPQFLRAALTNRPVWCDGSCPKVVAEALNTALSELAGRYGEDMTQWRWGEAHQASFKALLFGHIPVADSLTEIKAPTGGDDYTIQRGSMGSSDPGTFDHSQGAGMRAVYDLSDLDASRFIIATGQSGNPFSPHWNDQFSHWLAGRSFPLPPRRALPHALVLEPKG